MAKEKRNSSNKKKLQAQAKIKKTVSKTVKTKNKFPLILGGIIFVLAFLVYANTIGHGYALDDDSVISDSHIVRKGASAIGEIFQTRYREGAFGESSTLYRPLAVAMFAVEWQLSGGKPWLGHLVNVLLFAATCYLIFRVFSRIFKEKYSIAIAFLAALFFAVHPVHTEVVANIKSRDEILVMFFGMLALWQGWTYHHSQKSKHLLYSCLAILAGMFSKENAINFIAVIPLTIYFFSKISLARIAQMVGVYLIPVVIYLAARVSVLDSVFGIKKVEHIDNFLMDPNATWIEQKATALLVMGKYLLLQIFPQPLICDYNYNYIPITNMGNPMVIIALLVHVALLIYALLGLKKKQFLSYTILFYLGTMVLYSNLFVMIGAGMGERFLFISSLGFCLAIAYLLTRFLSRSSLETPINFQAFLQGKTGLFAISTILILLSSLATFSRNKDWKDSFTLYQADIKKAPESARLNGYLGTELLQKGKNEVQAVSQQAYYEKAIEVYHKAIEIYPLYTEAKGQLGLSYFRKGNYPEAAKWYEDAIDDGGTKGTIYNNYGMMYFTDALRKQQAGNVQGFNFAIDKAKTLFEQAIQREPNYTDGYMNMGSTLGVLGNHAQAVNYFNLALQFANKEQQSLIYSNLAKAYHFLGNKGAAREAEKKANSIPK